ncbi:MAG: ABC transporter permease [Prevotellaceae bacterium]|nr:ABC transporter permease [Prevotellaceae bacterium]
MNTEMKESIWAETGKFCIDIAKLVFGGIILASIMRINVSQSFLFMCGGIAFIALVFVGVSLIALSKYQNKK